MKKLMVVFILLSSAVASADSLASIISTCEREFGIGPYAVDCARSAPSTEIVLACVDHFGFGSYGVQCVQRATTVEAVEACEREFGFGIAGVECLR